MDQSTLIATAAGVMAFVLAVQSVALWRLRRALGGVHRLDEKLGHFGDALSLLTETTESGFHAVAAELDRVARPPATATLATSPAATPKSAIRKTLARSSDARINAAVRRGRSVAEIAAAEDVSEGEIRLRLHLAKQAEAARAKTKKSVAEPRRTRMTLAGAKGTGAEGQADGTVRA